MMAASRAASRVWNMVWNMTSRVWNMTQWCVLMVESVLLLVVGCGGNVYLPYSHRFFIEDINVEGCTPDIIHEVSQYTMVTGLASIFGLCGVFFGKFGKYSPTEMFRTSSFKLRTVLNEKKNGNMCCICLNGYEFDQDVSKLHCKHCFHSGCIKSWVQRSQSCPICRASL
jgi:hypothetical protein